MRKQLYKPGQNTQFNISRSRIDKYISCPRCFYIEMVYGARQNFPSFTLNNAVDNLLKNEFDHYRERNEPHPIMLEYGIDAVPYQHFCLDNWRNFRRGISFIDQRNAFKVYGAIDDIWKHRDGSLIVADYKATSTTKPINLNDKYKIAYRRQLDIYAWLFEQNGFRVHNKGYFIYCNADANLPKFNSVLNFNVQVLYHDINTSWVSGVLDDIKRALDSPVAPVHSDDCEQCKYNSIVKSVA